MNRNTSRLLIRLALVLGVAIMGTLKGAVVLKTDDYECANLVTKLTDLVERGDYRSEAGRLLRGTLLRKLEQKCELR